MGEAYIVEAPRTAGGRPNGRLAGVHAVDLPWPPWSGRRRFANVWQRWADAYATICACFQAISASSGKNCAFAVASAEAAVPRRTRPLMP